MKSLSRISAVTSELENFSHRTHDAVEDFYLFVQIIEKSLVKVSKFTNAVYDLNSIISSIAEAIRLVCYCEFCKGALDPCLE